MLRDAFFNVFKNLRKNKFFFKELIVFAIFFSKNRVGKFYYSVEMFLIIGYDL